MRALRSLCLAIAALVFGASLFVAQTLAAEGEKPVKRDYGRVTAPPAPRGQTLEAMLGKSEGCNSCHVKTDAPTMHVSEAVRLGCTDCHGGDASVSGDSSLDHDDPRYVAARDRAHVLPKYPDSWHFNHMLDPASMSPGSIMPSYGWLFDHEIDTVHTYGKIRAMQTLGVPYPSGYADQANKDLLRQEEAIKASLKGDKISVGQNKEIIAIIAYLQRMGRDIKSAPKDQTASVKDGNEMMGN